MSVDWPENTGPESANSDKEFTVKATVKDANNAAAQGTAELWVDDAQVGSAVAVGTDGAVSFPGMALKRGDHDIEVRFVPVDGYRQSTGSTALTVLRANVVLAPLSSTPSTRRPGRRRSTRASTPRSARRRWLRGGAPTPASSVAGSPWLRAVRSRSRTTSPMGSRTRSRSRSGPTRPATPSGDRCSTSATASRRTCSSRRTTATTPTPSTGSPRRSSPRPGPSGFLSPRRCRSTPGRTWSSRWPPRTTRT